MKDQLKNVKRIMRLGFTTAEMLTAVAILGILTAIAIPSVMSLRSTLKLASLDNAARSIYMSAQNRMSELRTSGLLYIHEGDSSLGGERITEMPSDYSEDDFPWMGGDYFRLSSRNDSENLSLLLPAGSIESALFEGSFYIEYNAATGTIYSVFYAEEEFSYTNSLPRNDRSARRSHNPMLGYFGGTGIEGWDEIDNTQAPVFEIENDDILAVHFAVEPDTKYTLTISDGENTWRFLTEEDFISTRPDNITLTDNVYTVILDRLYDRSGNDDMRFSTLFSEYGFIPGTNLTITLTGKSPNAIPTSFVGTANSLFATANIATAGEDSLSVSVLSPRHLQNLHPDYSNVLSRVTHATIGRSINWLDSSVDQFLSINNPYLININGGGNPIINLNSSLFDSFGGAVDSAISNVILTNTNIASASGYAAGALANTLRNTTLTRCFVYATSDQHSITATDSQIISSADTTGGLIGYAQNSTFINCAASLTRIVGTRSEMSMGGLAGTLVDSTVRNSYAATGLWNFEEHEWVAASGLHVPSDGLAGGFAGIIQNGSIDNCYAVGNIRIDTGIGAGFSGNANGSINTSYTAMDFMASPTGTNNSPSPSLALLHGFADGDYTGDNNYFLRTSALKGASAIASGSTSYEELRTILSGGSWSSATLLNTSPFGWPKETTDGEAFPFPFPRLIGMVHFGDWPGDSSKGTLLYYERYADGSYGFYGNIEDRELNTLRDDLTIVFDSYAFALLNGSNTIKYRTSATENQFTSFNLEGILPDNVVASIRNQLLLDEGFNIFPIPDELSQQMQMYFTSAYYEFKIGEAAIFYNPDFAKSIITINDSDDSPQPPNADGTSPVNYEMRTARHISMLGNNSRNHPYRGHYLLSRYTQTRNIDFTTYDRERLPANAGGDSSDNSRTIRPIGNTTANSFVGSFNGNSYRITIISFQSAPDTNAGFFGILGAGGAIRNVHLVGGESNTTITRFSADNIGGIVNGGALAASIIGGIVENCSVTNISITGVSSVHVNSARNLGGLVGSISAGGRIINSQAQGGTISGGHRSGGLVGNIFNPETLIENSRAIDMVVRSTNRGGGQSSGSPGAISITGTGGFAGVMTGGQITESLARNVTIDANPVQSEGEAQNFNRLRSGSGGFVGSMSNSNTRIDNSFALSSSINGPSNITSGDHGIGGFIGLMENGIISRSGASIGYFSETKGGSISGVSGSTVGGFAGSITASSTIDNSYTVSRLSSDSDSGGFLGRTNVTPNIRNSYCITANSNGHFVSFGGNNLPPTNVHYDGGNIDTLNDAFSSPWGAASFSYPTDSNLSGEMFPFPSVVTNGNGDRIHYGNWPVPPDEPDPDDPDEPEEPVGDFTDGLYYYERYQSGSDNVYGFYGILGDRNVNTLRNDLALSEDGYALIIPEISSPQTITATASLPWGGTGQSTISKSDITLRNLSGDPFSVYFLRPNDAVMCPSSDTPFDYYLPLTLNIPGQGTRNAQFNPYFAKQAINSSSLHAAPDITEVRTARHLFHLSRITSLWNTLPFWSTLDYLQTRNIDFAQYDSAFGLGDTLVGISVYRNPFTGSYNGGHNIITGISIPDTGNSGGRGLFGVLGQGGRLSNIVFLADNPSRTVQAAGWSGTGTLTGVNEGTIENCAVAGFNIVATSGSPSTGGFVGLNASTGIIRGCSASNASFPGQDPGGSLSADGWLSIGGFVGSNNGVIEDSYTFSSYREVTAPTIGSFAGTNSGSILNAYSATLDVNQVFMPIINFSGSGSFGTNTYAFVGDNLSAINNGLINVSGWGHTQSNSPFPAIVTNGDGDLVHYGVWAPTG